MNKTMRVGVGAVVVNERDQVLILERRDRDGAWQFPQGGVELDEEPSEAIQRELEEETGLDESRITLASEYPSWLPYVLPVELQSNKTGIGQVQRWFLYRLTGGDGITIGSENSEFQAYRWVPLGDAVAGAVAFKRSTYEKVAAYFSAYLGGEAPQLSTNGRAYVLTEFNHLMESFQKNEELGERRLNGYVSLIGLLAAGLGLGFDVLQRGNVDMKWVSLAVVFSALLFGASTFARLLKRNVDTTDLLTKISRIRGVLTSGDPIAVSVVPFAAPKARRFRPQAGGLATSTALINALLVGAAVGLVTAGRNVGPATTIASSATAVVLAFVAHWLTAAHVYRRSSRRAE